MVVLVIARFLKIVVVVYLNLFFPIVTFFARGRDLAASF